MGISHLLTSKAKVEKKHKMKLSLNQKKEKQTARKSYPASSETSARKVEGMEEENNLIKKME
jgi:hypothetical protein